MKNAEAAISSQKGSKKFEYWEGGGALKKLGLGGGGLLIWGSYFCLVVSTPLHPMLTSLLKFA